jgi:DHA1 family bicyclomycin/chloramphenicol resistance-like MFS transporter
MSDDQGWSFKLPYTEFIVLISMLMAVTALSIDAMLPANPQITAQFGISRPEDLQLIVNVFFLGFALSQLFYGPLADRFGRKPILLLGLAIFVCASVFAIFASSFEALIAARFFQGIGSGAPRVVPSSIIRDLTDGRQMAKLMSLTMMVFIIVPVLAPAVGELILLAGHWQWIFVMLTVMALILCTWLIIRLPETLAEADRQPLNPSAILENIKYVLKHPVTMGYTLSLSAVFGAFNIYLSTSQPIFDQLYHLGDRFALIFGFIAMFMGVSSYLNSRWVITMGMRNLSQTALISFTVLSCLFVFACWTFDGLPPDYIFIGLMAALLFLIGIIFPNQHALAMEPMGKLAGTAASVIGSISTTIGVILGTLVGYWLNDSLLPMAVAFLIYGTLSLGIATYTIKFSNQ